MCYVGVDALCIHAYLFEYILLISNIQKSGCLLLARPLSEPWPNVQSPTSCCMVIMCIE